MSTMIYTATEQFADFNKVNVAQAQRRSPRSPWKTPRSSSTLNLNAAKVVLAKGVEGAAAVAAGQGRARPDGAARQVRRDGRRRPPPPTRAASYEISSQAQAQFTALAEEAWSTYTKDTAAWVEKASKSAPAGSEPAVNAFKSTFAASTAAFDQFQKATKQVVSLADASVRAASANAANTAKSASEGSQGCVSSTPKVQARPVSFSSS